MDRGLDVDDEGKPLVTPDGRTVGTVEAIRGGDVLVRPMPGSLAGVGSWITGTWDDGPYTLDDGTVVRVTGDVVVIDVEGGDPTPRAGQR